MKHTLLTVFILINLSATAQTLKFSAGISRSTLDWNFGGSSFYNDPLTGISLQAGVDYLEKKYLNLSSNIGFLQKGGSSQVLATDNAGNDIGTRKEKAQLNYATFNTTVDLLLPLSGNITTFLSIGPRLDYLLSTSDNINPGDNFNKLMVGANTGAGIRYKLNRLIIGVRGDYLHSFGKIYESTNTNVTDRTFDVKAFVAIKL